MAPLPALLFSSSPSFRRVDPSSARVSTAFSLNRPSPLHSALLTIPRASQTEDHILPRPAVPTPTSTLPPPSTHQNTASDPRRAARSPADGMPPPQHNSAPRLALPAMARSQADLNFPSLISDLTSLLLHSPAGAASSSSGPVFSSSSLSIPTPTPKPKPNPSPTSATATPTPLARAAIGACAGAAAGAFTYAALLPIDAVKTRLQVQAPSATSWQVFLDILRTDGPLGLYRGLSAVILGSASSSAVYFGTCELAKSLLRPHLPPFLVPPLAGASGNVSSSAIMVPKELITQRLQSGAATGRSWQVLLGILRADGFFGLYAGYAATLLRNLPAGVLSYSSFEYLKAFTLKRRAGESLTPGESVLCGALAGAISAALTTPLDVVKTRLMTRVGAEGSRTVLGTMREVVAEEGLVGLSRGIGPRVLHSACFAALGYCAFETARLAILQCYLERCQIKAKAAAQPEVEPGVAAAAAT